MSEAEKQEKCTVRDSDFVEPCYALEEVIQNSTPAFSRKKGVAVWNYRKRVNGKSVPSRTMIGIICDAYPNGVMFNHCPFCGEEISAPFYEKQSEDAA